MEIPQFKSNFFFKMSSEMVSFHCAGLEYKLCRSIDIFINKILKLRTFTMLSFHFFELKCSFCNETILPPFYFHFKWQATCYYGQLCSVSEIVMFKFLRHSIKRSFLFISFNWFRIKSSNLKSVL